MINLIARSSGPRSYRRTLHLFSLLVAGCLLLVPQASWATSPKLEKTPSADLWKTGSRSGPSRLAVMKVRVTAEDLDPVVGESIAAVLAAELTAISRGRYRVISRNDLRSIVGQQIEAQQMGCTDPKCLVDIGKLATADHMVSSSVGKVGEEWVFTLELVDVAMGQVLRRQAVTWLGEPQGLVELCRPYVARLIEGTVAAQYTGSLRVLSDQEDALVHFDEKEAGKTPIKLFPDVPIGRHRVQVKKDGFVLFINDVVVHRNETTLLQAELIDESTLTPWYRKWWVWVGAGAIVAGAAATAVAVQADEAVPPTTLKINTQVGGSR